MAVHDRVHVGPRTIDLAVYEALQVRPAAARIDRVTGESVFHDVVAYYDRGREAPREMKPICSLRVTYTDMAEPVHHTFVVENVIRDDEIVDQFVGCHAGIILTTSTGIRQSCCRDLCASFC